MQLQIEFSSQPYPSAGGGANFTPGIHTSKIVLYCIYGTFFFSFFKTRNGATQQERQTQDADVRLDDNIILD